MLRKMMALALVLGASLSAPLTQAADVFSGQQVYEQECMRCHGASGRGTLSGGIDFSLGDGLQSSDVALLSRVENGKGGCPSYFGILDREKILDVIAYIRTLH